MTMLTLLYLYWPRAKRRVSGKHLYRRTVRLPRNPAAEGLHRLAAEGFDLQVDTTPASPGGLGQPQEEAGRRQSPPRSDGRT